MDSHTSHKVIVASALAIAFGLGLTLLLASQQHAQLTAVAPAPQAMPAADTAAPAAATPAPNTNAPANAPEAAAPLPEVAAVRATPPVVASHRPAHSAGSGLSKPSPGSTDDDSANRIAAASPPPPAPALPSGGGPAASEPIASPASGASVDLSVAGAAGPAAPAASPAPSPAATPAVTDAAQTPAADSSDGAITVAAQSALSADSMTNRANITVTTHDGVVMLSGTVRNQDTFDRARAAAARVRDVKGVDTNGLVIVGS